jgi:DNA-directed RNA polymerase II subunit RPB9
MKFCKVCDNMLYINVDTDSQELSYTCKNCGFEEKEGEMKESILISEKKFNQDNALLTNFLNPNIKYDNTLPRVNNIVCPRCTQTETIFIKYDHANMKYLYFCCKCDNFWRNE